MCQTVQYSTTAGHLATPNFPNVYPQRKHCVCNLHSTANDSSGKIRLDFTHFLVKYDQPCLDWVEITVNGNSRRLCGSHKMSVIGSNISVVFHSDSTSGHQGLWCQFSRKCIILRLIFSWRI